MKTNRFEEILRRKLESIQPDFQDQDWDKWQSFKQLHAPPSFWQSYGHWLGYAVATVTTAVMVVLYVNQSNQNEVLLKEMEGLKQQMTTQANGKPGYGTDSLADAETQPARSNPRPDTVYIIERQTVYRDIPFANRTQPAGSILEESQPPLQNPVATQRREVKEGATQESQSESLVPTIEVQDKANSRVAQSNTNSKPGATVQDKRQSPDSESRVKESQRADSPPPTEPASSKKSTETSASPPNTSSFPNRAAGTLEKEDLAEARSAERVELGDLAPLPAQQFSNSRNYLYRRLQGRMPQKARNLGTAPDVAKAATPSTKEKPMESKSEEKKQMAELPASDKKVEEVKNEESLLPNFGLNLPFRIGVSQEWVGKNKAFSLWNEVLLGSNWSVQAGVSWKTLETQKFVTEKKFRDDMREDFRKQHAKRLPPNFQIFNITTQTTLLQIPVGLTYRGDMGRGFTYLIGGGTNLNIRAKQVLRFDFERPTQDYGQQSAEQYVVIPLLNNAQFSAGLEKRWSPIVIQAKSFVETRVKTFPFLKDRTNVGFRVKILYEFGAAKKN